MGCGGSEGADVCVPVQDPEDHEDMPYQDFSDIVPDLSIGVVLFSFQMRRASSLSLSYTSC